MAKSGLVDVTSAKSFDSRMSVSPPDSRDRTVSEVGLIEY